VPKLTSSAGYVKDPKTDFMGRLIGMFEDQLVYFGQIGVRKNITKPNWVLGHVSC